MSEIKKIRWGILGTNWISSVMAEAIQKSKTSELAAIGSRDINRAMEFAAKHAIKKFYSDYDELLADPNVDMIYIGLPNHLHKEWIIRCAEAGKHILCEKPFVLDIKEANEAFAAVQKNNVFCMEALMYRYHPFIAHLEQVLRAKTIGDIKHITATYNVNIAAVENHTAGGSIRSLGCYPVSLVRLIAKDDTFQIMGTGKINENTKTDMMSVALCIFNNGITATISTSDILDWHWQFTVYGTAGTLEVLTNPWLPETHNQFSLKINGKTELVEFTADQPLYTYQIDYAGERILNNNIQENWKFTLGNIDFLERWLYQVKRCSSDSQRILAQFSEDTVNI